MGEIHRVHDKYGPVYKANLRIYEKSYNVDCECMVHMKNPINSQI